MIEKVDILRRIPGALLLSAPTLPKLSPAEDDDGSIRSNQSSHRLRSRACWSNQSIANKRDGCLFCTVPIIVDRITRTRQGLPRAIRENRTSR